MPAFSNSPCSLNLIIGRYTAPTFLNVTDAGEFVPFSEQASGWAKKLTGTSEKRLCKGLDAGSAA